MGLLNIDAYPLLWPETWPRTEKYKRKSSRYVANFAKARDEIVRELKLLGAKEIVVSTGVPLRKDGLPYAGMSEPDDPGVAIYWAECAGYKDGQSQYVHRVIACDHWRTVRENMRAAGLAIEALRALKRTGATQVVEKAFTGFAALPNPERKRTWRVVMGYSESARPSRLNLEARFRELTMNKHPDKGGSDSDMRELIAAREEALREGLS